jgi:hypothetical protein
MLIDTSTYQQRLNLRRWFLVTLATWFISGCALTPNKPQALQQSNSLLSSQLDAAERHLNKSSADSIQHIYVGSAQHSQSLAFQRDVLALQQKLQTLNTETTSILLSNEMETQQLKYPFATVPNLQLIFDKLAKWSNQQPISLTLLITTHGAPDILSVNIGNSYYQAVRSEQLKTWLNKLHPRTPMTVILSACYSGSFADTISGGNRIVLTAAAADRNSFGCNYHENNTWFIAQLLGPHFTPDKTWSEVFAATHDGIELQEKAQNTPHHSNPQMRSPDALKRNTLGQWYSSRPSPKSNLQAMQQ